MHSKLSVYVIICPVIYHVFITHLLWIPLMILENWNSRRAEVTYYDRLLCLFEFYLLFLELNLLTLFPLYYEFLLSFLQTEQTFCSALRETEVNGAKCLFWWPWYLVRQSRKCQWLPYTCSFGTQRRSTEEMIHLLGWVKNYKEYNISRDVITCRGRWWKLARQL